MSYGGICSGSDFVQDNDLIFHAASIEQINDVINSAPTSFRDPSPFAVTPISNAVPLVDATPGNAVTPTTVTSNSVTSDTSTPHFYIPAATPFSLDASGTDADGDTLTYSWEQLDLGPAQNLPLSGSVSDGPLFALICRRPIRCECFRTCRTC